MADAQEERLIRQALVGIDELVSHVSGGDQAASALGERITDEEDWGLEPDGGGTDIQAVEE